MVPRLAKTPSFAAVFAFSLAIPFSTIGTTHAQEPAPAEEAQPDPADVYFQGFKATRAAEKLEQAADFIGAAEKLDKAARCFENIQRDHPDWKKDMVAGRTEKIARAIAENRTKADEQRKAPNPPAAPEPGTRDTDSTRSTTPAEDVRKARERLEALESAPSRGEAAPDPAEVEALQEIIRRLSRAQNRRPDTTR